MIKNDIKKIVEAGIKAPSGDNMQPWKCILNGETLELYNVAGKDKSLYNFNEYGSYFAHGAFLENVMITAEHLNYEALITLFPELNDENHVATITFKPTTSSKNRNMELLYKAIYQRSTNRKSYDTNPPLENKLEYYKSLVSQYEGCELLLVTNKNDKKILSYALALNERLMLENSYIHDALFGIIRWTDEEEAKTRTGLYIKTLELNPIQRKMFNWFNNRKTLDILLKCGFGKLLPKLSSALYRASGAICTITIPEDSKLSFIIAGRAFERLWLTLIIDGLSLQPTAGVVYLGKRILHGQIEHLPEKHVKLITESFNIIQKVFKINKKSIALTFRIGKGETPSMSRRLPVEKILTVK